MRPVDDDRLDLSPLDPTRDAARFEAMVRSVTARAVGRGSPAAVMVGWARPALALAASIALAAWGPSLWATQRADPEGAAKPGEVLLEWAHAGAPASAAEVLESLVVDP